MQKSFQYYIDIAGTCNLACPSCPVGMEKSKSLNGVTRSRGMMSVDLLDRIFAKIAAERPTESVLISFFNWGEPLLNPKLPEMIRMAKKHGFRVGISTNFNVDADIRAIVAAEPHYFKISLSGYSQETYGKTHRNGDVNILISNIYRLRYYMDRLNVNFNVFINYHMYKHNMGEDILKMNELAQKVRFNIIPDVASLISPIEFFLSERKPSEDEDLINDLLLFSMEEKIATGKHISAPTCVLRDNDMVINHDGSVALCCATYDDSMTIAKSFLDVDHKELQKRKYQSEICRACMSKGLHTAVTMRISPKAVNERLAAIGSPVRLPA